MSTEDTRIDERTDNKLIQLRYRIELTLHAYAWRRAIPLDESNRSMNV
jgi:hypothetical protein